MVHADSALANVELKGRDAITGPWQVEFMQLMKIFSSFPPSFNLYCPCGLGCEAQARVFGLACRPYA